jgi:hypothetical protein
MALYEADALRADFQVGRFSDRPHNQAESAAAIRLKRRCRIVTGCD